VQPQAQLQTSAPAPAANSNLASRVDAIEQKEAAEPTVQVGEGKGLTITSADKNFQLRLSGYFQADDHAFIGGNPSSNTDQFFIRSARPTFDAKIYDNFSARLMFDFGSGQTALLDAYGDYNAADAFNLRVGKFKDPIGIERWQAEKNVLFVERGMTTNLVPYRDNGVGVYGNLIPGTIEYQVALTNGAPDLVNATNSTDDDQNVTARVFTHPFHNTDNGILKGIGVGVAGSYGNRNGSGSNAELTSGYVTPAQTKFFTYTVGASAATTAFASGPQWRFNPEATYYNGPFSILSEYVVEDQGLRLGGTTRTLQNNAWMLASTYVLTGEDAKFDGVIPRNNFDPIHDQWGAFELVGRFSQLHVDDAAFPIFASLSTSAKAAQETTLGGTWYLNPMIKFNLDFNISQFTGGAVGGNLPTEKAVLTRAQVSF
jgi:phosphate-selective porin OprO/OprP